MRLGCLCVVAGLDRHCHASLHVYTLNIIKIKQLVAMVVLVGTSPLSSGDPCHYDTNTKRTVFVVCTLN